MQTFLIRKIRVDNIKFCSSKLEIFKVTEDFQIDRVLG